MKDAYIPGDDAELVALTGEPRSNKYSISM